MRDTEGLCAEDLKRLLDLSCSISAGLAVDEYRNKVLELLLGMFASRAGNFFLSNRDMETVNLSSVFTHEIGKEWHEAFRSYYQYLDPCLHRSMNRAAAYTLDDIVNLEQFRSSEYYVNFLRPQGIFHELVLLLGVPQKFVGVIALFRPEDCPPYSEGDKVKARLMLPYLSSGLERALLFEETKQKTWILESSVRGQGGAGILVVDKDLEVVFVNDEASGLLGWRGEARGVTRPGTDRQSSAWPEKLLAICSRLAKTLAEDRKSAARPEEVSWTTSDGRTLVARLSAISGQFFGQCQNFVVARMGTRYGSGMQLPETIREHYRLTQREVEVVGEVVKGASNTEIAEDLFISSHTVENHLKRIFRKMGVRNRTELSYKLLD